MGNAPGNAGTATVSIRGCDPVRMPPSLGPRRRGRGGRTARWGVLIQGANVPHCRPVRDRPLLARLPYETAPGLVRGRAADREQPPRFPRSAWAGRTTPESLGGWVAVSYSPAAIRADTRSASPE